ncbi:MAG: hypothetical protein Kow0092_13730 [Deferrisomatales bacterium]
MHRPLALACALLTLSAATLWAAVAPAASPREITIAYSVDDRGEIEPCG